MNEKEAAVKAVLQTLMPAMEADGGGVELVSITDDIVTVRFKGACLVCPSIKMTFEFGIKQTLEKTFPWIKNIKRI